MTPLSVARYFIKVKNKRKKEQGKIDQIIVKRLYGVVQFLPTQELVVEGAGDFLKGTPVKSPSCT